MDDRNNADRYNRRDALGLIGGALTMAALSSPARAAGSLLTSSCRVAAAKTQGPYWVDDQLYRSDIRTDTLGSAGQQQGAVLALTLYVLDHSSSCAALQNVYVDIWHCNALGIYSDESVEATANENYLRGYQITDASGKVTFTTIIPGWYSGRAPHIHVRLRSFSSSGTPTYDNTTQLFFSTRMIDTIYKNNAPYNTRSSILPDTPNAQDNIYQASLLTALKATDEGYSSSFKIGYPLSGQGN
jgi:protocatechuate 3,4-dioxygenase beta subunit